MLKGIIGLFFICKRHAGEKCTWADVSALTWADLPSAEPGELSSDVEPDPTQALAAEVEQGDNGEPSKNELSQSPMWSAAARQGCCF